MPIDSRNWVSRAISWANVGGAAPPLYTVAASGRSAAAGHSVGDQANRYIAQNSPNRTRWLLGVAGSGTPEVKPADTVSGARLPGASAEAVGAPGSVSVQPSR